jgi:hypothetical protein
LLLTIPGVPIGTIHTSKLIIYLVSIDEFTKKTLTYLIPLLSIYNTRHELTAEQTGGGAFGMLIIEDNLQNLNSWAHPQNELILQISDIGSGTVGNGNSNENIQVEVGKWYRLRVSVVTPGAKASDVSFSGGDCTVYRVASDGVWHTAALTTYAGSSFELTGASRADFAINCASSATTQIEWDRATAATLEAGSFGSGTGSDETDLGTAPSRPYALRGLIEVAAWDTFSISLSAAKINGADWDPVTPLDMIDYDKVHQWTISGSGAHPFHLHLYHMLIVEPGGCGAHKEGEFYDTISAQGSCTVRFKTADFGQRMIMVSDRRPHIVHLFVFIMVLLTASSFYSIVTF